jgi:DNA-binding YbaB/EbfC family protein
MAGGFGNIMLQARRMQGQIKSLQDQLEQTEFEGAAGGGLVKVTVDGRQKVKKLTITREAINPDDLDELSDIVTAALNMALTASLEHSQAEMKKITAASTCPPRLIAPHGVGHGSHPTPRPGVLSPARHRGKDGDPADVLRPQRPPPTSPASSPPRSPTSASRVRFCSVCCNLTEADPCRFLRGSTPRRPPRLREEEFNQIQAIVVRLVKEANARGRLHRRQERPAHRASGETDNLDTTSLASLTAGNIAATGGMAKLLRRTSSPTQFHEGEKANIHIQLVGNRVILVVIFDSEVEPRPRAPAREEGERGAQQHLRGAAPQGAGPEP